MSSRDSGPNKARELPDKLLGFAAGLLGTPVEELSLAPHQVLVTACHDIGRAINPQSVVGRIQGGAAMGIGYKLMQEIQVSEGINQTGLFYTILK